VISLPLSPSLCGSCIIRLSLLNPRSNLKSEEKLDSLIGRERKSRLGRREPLIKSYRLSSPFTSPSSRPKSPQIFAAKKPQTFLLPSLFTTLLHSFFFPSYRRVVNDPRWFCRLISHPLLICFNYTASSEPSLLIRQLSCKSIIAMLCQLCIEYHLLFYKKFLDKIYTFYAF